SLLVSKKTKRADHGTNASWKHNIPPELNIKIGKDIYDLPSESEDKPPKRAPQLKKRKNQATKFKLTNPRKKVEKNGKGKAVAGAITLKSRQNEMTARDNPNFSTAPIDDGSENQHSDSR